MGNQDKKSSPQRTWTHISPKDSFPLGRGFPPGHGCFKSDSQENIKTGNLYFLNWKNMHFEPSSKSNDASFITPHWLVISPISPLVNHWYSGSSHWCEDMTIVYIIFMSKIRLISIHHNISQYITRYHSISLYITIHHNISQYITRYHSISLYITIYHNISLDITLYHYISLYITLYHYTSQYITIYH